MTQSEGIGDIFEVPEENRRRTLFNVPQSPATPGHTTQFTDTGGPIGERDPPKHYSRKSELPPSSKRFSLPYIPTGIPWYSRIDKGGGPPDDGSDDDGSDNDPL